MLIQPLESSIKAEAHDPEYTVHRYFARRPHNVINNAISHYLPQKNSLVFDPFGGGGTMLYEALTLGHRAIACDTSDLACFVIEQEALMASANLEELSEFINQLMAHLSDIFAPIYSFNGNEVYWIEWSSYTYCPKCGTQVLLSPFNAAGGGKYICKKCANEFRPARVNADNILPVEICCVDNGSIKNGRALHQVRSAPGTTAIKQYYENLCKELEHLGLKYAMEPRTEIPDCNMQRESALHKKGFVFFEQFIPTASRAIVCHIGDYINSSSLTQMQKEQLLFVLSASLRYCSRFSTLNKAWRGDRPMEWAKSNFWTPYTFVEVNPIITFYERWLSYSTAVKKAQSKFSKIPKPGTCSEVIRDKRNFSVINTSSESVPDLPNESVDLVITDPPYGSYLHYGELSAFWTTWLSKFIPRINSVPSRTSEAVPARKKGYPGWKNFNEYEQILSTVFAECHRVLKDEHYCVVTFNNKEPEAWIAFLRAVKRAGFHLPDNGIVFQDGVSAYKKTIDSRRGGAIFGDFIYSFYKDSSRLPLILSADNANTWRENLDKNLKLLAQTCDIISNVDLYTKVYFSLLPELYNAIDVSERDDTFLKDLSFKNFEAKIEEYFRYENGFWIRK